MPYVAVTEVTPRVLDTLAREGLVGQGRRGEGAEGRREQGGMGEMGEMGKQGGQGERVIHLQIYPPIHPSTLLST